MSGDVYIDCDIIHICNSSRKQTVLRLPVDPNSVYSWISADLLEKIGVEVEKQVTFDFANGQTMTRSVGYAIFRVENYITIDEVVFSLSGEVQLLGSRTLAGFRAYADARKNRLMPVIQFLVPWEPSPLVE